MALPFSFDFYGQFYNSVFINTNGNITLVNCLTGFAAAGFPAGPGGTNGDTVIVAPFWADVDLSAPVPNINKVQFKVTPTALYVNWTDVGYYPEETDLLNTFQLIITDGTDPVVANGANTSFCYKDMQWTTG